jgi:hypothetical protein
LIDPNAVDKQAHRIALPINCGLGTHLSWRIRTGETPMTRKGDRLTRFEPNISRRTA